MWVKREVCQSRRRRISESDESERESEVYNVQNMSSVRYTVQQYLLEGMYTGMMNDDIFPARGLNINISLLSSF